MKIAFIGGGNMASALIAGLAGKLTAGHNIHVVDPNADALERLRTQYGVTTAAVAGAAVADADVIVLAVKPQSMREVAAQLLPLIAKAPAPLSGTAQAPLTGTAQAPMIAKAQAPLSDAAQAPLSDAAQAPLTGTAHAPLFVSIAAGIRGADLSRWLGGHQAIVRCMPNTPALIGMGITGMVATSGVTAQQKQAADDILRAVGPTVWLDDESKIDAVTAISGSGPAYVFYFIEALQQAAAELGLDPEQGTQLALATFAGAAQLATQSSEPVALLRERVTSKGGTTYAALTSMEDSGVKAAIIKAARAAADRGKELGDELGG